MGQVASFPPFVLWRLGGADVGGRLLPVVFVRNRRGTKSGNAHELRSSAHEMRQRWRPNRVFSTVILRCELLRASKDERPGCRTGAVILRGSPKMARTSQAGIFFGGSGWKASRWARWVESL